jgi:hypothetical protein
MTLNNTLKMQKYNKLVIAAIIGFASGIMFIIYFKKHTSLYFANDVSFEINPLEIFSIGVNIFLAIYITRTLSKKNDQEKSEKELIINYLKDFQLEYNSKTNKLLECEDFETPLTNSCFKTLRTRINSILALAEENKIIENNDETASKIKQKISEIWELFTDTPRTANSRANQATKDGIQTLRFEKIGKIEAASIDLDKLIFQLAMKINRR